MPRSTLHGFFQLCEEDYLNRKSENHPNILMITDVLVSLEITF